MAKFNLDDPEVRRHYEGWKGFTRFLLIASTAVAVILLLMAAFLT